MTILSTRICLCMTVGNLLFHILKLFVSININFKYYWSSKTGIPLEYTSEAKQFNNDILFTSSSMLVRSCRKHYVSTEIWS